MTENENTDIKKLVIASLRNEPGSSKGALLLLVVFVLLPFFTFGFGVYKAYCFWDLKAHGILTEAIVVDVYEAPHSKSSSLEGNFHPVVRFKDQNGVQHKLKTGRVKKTKYRVGKKVAVLYDTNNVNHIVIDDFKENMIVPVFLLFLGGIGSLFVVFTIRNLVSDGTEKKN